MISGQLSDVVNMQLDRGRPVVFQGTEEGVPAQKGTLVLEKTTFTTALSPHPSRHRRFYLCGGRGSRGETS